MLNMYEEMEKINMYKNEERNDNPNLAPDCGYSWDDYDTTASDDLGIITPENDNVNVTNVTNDTEQGKNYKKYSGFSFAECCRNPQPIKWTIKGYIPERGLCMMFGASGSYKSFLAYDMAGSIACKEIETWHGKRIKHGSVVIFAGEGSDGVKLRFAGWAIKKAINPDKVKLYIFDEVFKLDGTTEDNEDEINRTIWNIKQVADKPELVVLDTLNCYMSGDENRAVDMGKFLGLCKRIIQELGCAVLLLHHTGNDENTKDRARGSSALRAALDSEMKVSKSGDSLTAVLKQTKNKDARKEKDIIFDLERVIIPECFDEDGYQVDTLVPALSTEKTQLAEEEAKKKPEKQRRMPQGEKTAHETYETAVAKFGVILHEQNEDGTETEVIGVEFKHWQKVFFDNSSADNSNTRQKQFDRARKLLLETKHHLIKRVIQDREFYCLADTNTPTAATLRDAIQERENSTNRERPLQFSEN